MLKKLEKELQQLANPQHAQTLSRFFKTGPGQYGEGDIFLGIKTPVLRQLVKKYKDLSLSDLTQLLKSKIHEHRAVALSILTTRFAKADDNLRQQIYQFYLANTQYINNWDLVDISAPKIVGSYLLDKEKERKILYSLAKSQDLWQKRIAMLSTYTFIKKSQFTDALAIAQILVNDQHDLIHKAVGWMLRELGKIDQNVEEQFLNQYAATMPRTMLRYAIEKFNDNKRKHYLNFRAK